MNTTLSEPYRESLVRAYDQLIRDHITRGYDPYFINFMFNQIPWRRTEVMKEQVSRVHDILTRHVVRDRASSAWKELRPIFIGSPDLPVFKHVKGSGQLYVANDGLHYNAIALVPPPYVSCLPRIVSNSVFGRHSRLTVPLGQHFLEKSRFYLTETLSRIDVTPIVRGTMADYTFKAFKNGRMDSDNIQIWN